MNLELTQLYRSLNHAQLASLLESYQDAPKMLTLLELLKQQGLANTNKAVSHIYKNELIDTDRTMLNNRFYKLRQKLRDSLLPFLKEEQAGLLPEEQELICVRSLLDNNQFSLAASRLSKLEEHCWAQNIFELLDANNANLIFIEHLECLLQIAEDINWKLRCGRCFTVFKSCDIEGYILFGCH